MANDSGFIQGNATGLAGSGYRNPSKTFGANQPGRLASRYSGTGNAGSPRYLPNSAGAAMSAVARFPSLLSPAGGLIVLCAYTAAALVLAALGLTRRDA